MLKDLASFNEICEKELENYVSCNIWHVRDVNLLSDKKKHFLSLLAPSVQKNKMKDVQLHNKMLQKQLAFSKKN